MNKYVQITIIIAVITLGLGIIFTIVLDQTNTTVSIPLNSDKINAYLEKGCTKEALEFINENHPLELENSLENEIEKCMRVIIEDNRDDLFGQP